MNAIVSVDVDGDVWVGSMTDFIGANELDATVAAEVQSLPVGGVYVDGGGAGGLWTVTRVA